MSGTIEPVGFDFPFHNRHQHIQYSPRLMTGSHDDCSIHLIAIAIQVITEQEGTQGESQHEMRDVGELTVQFQIEQVHIVKCVVPTALTKRCTLIIAGIVTMPTQVKTGNGNAVGSQILCQLFITPDMLGHAVNDVEYSRRLVCEAAFAMFSKYKDCGNDTMEELFISVAAEKIFFDLRTILPRLCDIHTPQDISDDLAKVKALAAEINARRKAIELKDRPDRPSNKNDRVF